MTLFTIERMSKLMTFCNCKTMSGRCERAGQIKDDVILTIPDKWQPLDFGRECGRDISIDACIAPVIQHLWDNDIVTLGCCCGHGIEDPMVILPSSSYSIRRLEELFELIAKVDDRSWTISVWELISYSLRYDYVHKSFPVNNLGKKK